MNYRTECNCAEISKMVEKLIQIHITRMTHFVKHN